MVTFSNDILDIHVTLSSIVDPYGWKFRMKKNIILFITSHHLLVKCTTNLWLKHFTHRIWNNILWLLQWYNSSRHLVINFLIAKDKIYLTKWKLFVTHFTPIIEILHTNSLIPFPIEMQVNYHKSLTSK